MMRQQHVMPDFFFISCNWTKVQLFHAQIGVTLILTFEGSQSFIQNCEDQSYSPKLTKNLSKKVNFQSHSEPCGVLRCEYDVTISLVPTPIAQ